MSKRPNTANVDQGPAAKRGLTRNVLEPANKSPFETTVGPINRLMVYVRVKPLQEEVADRRTIIDVIDERTLIFDPVDSENTPAHEYFYHGKKYKQIGARQSKNANFLFDQVFDNAATNHYIYETVTKPMVQATVDGFNCSVFAYGATGSGKTHTMLGSRNYPGVIFYTAREIFSQIMMLNETDPFRAELKICYFEIYNENVRDLLKSPTSAQKRSRHNFDNHDAEQKSNRKNFISLPVRECSSEGGLSIPNLSCHQPSSPEELIELLEFGNTNRSQHPTEANADSSRSHAIFQIVLTRRLVNSSQEMSVQSSKMSLIDLAGSERATVAYRAGIDRSRNLQREGGNINKSLLALGNCINALADPKRYNNHVPFRDSKLTRLLRDCLGGNCRTAMIATICQQPSHYDETHNTLMYASRAKCIKLRADRNLTNVNIAPRNYAGIIENLTKKTALLARENEGLKSENEVLKNTLGQMQYDFQKQKETKRHQAEEETTRILNATQTIVRAQTPQVVAAASPPSPPESPMIEKLLSTSTHKICLDGLLADRRTIRLELLRLESCLKMNELKFIFRKHDTRIKCRNKVQSNKHTNNINNNQITRANSGNMTITILPSLANAIKDARSSASVLDALQEDDECNDHYTQSLRSQISHYEKERQTWLEAAEENDADILDIKNKLRLDHEKQYPSILFESVIDPYLSDKEQSLKLEEKEISEQHAYDLAQEFANRLSSYEEMLVDSAELNKYSHRLLQGRGGISEELESRFKQLYNKIDGKKSVVWKDDKFDQACITVTKSYSHYLNVHDTFSLTMTTPLNSNNTLRSRRLSRTLTTMTNYTPEQSNTTFDASTDIYSNN